VYDQHPKDETSHASGIAVNQRSGGGGHGSLGFSLSLSEQTTRRFSTIDVTSLSVSKSYYRQRFAALSRRVSTQRLAELYLIQSMVHIIPHTETERAIIGARPW